MTRFQDILNQDVAPLAKDASIKTLKQHIIADPQTGRHVRRPGGGGNEQMRISDLCIRRPVFATVLSLSIMLVGLVSYTRLPVREYPKIDEPVVTVDTTYRGTSAEIVESQISKPLEDSLAGIEGVDVITSISRQENSQISVRFKLKRNPDSAAADVRDRVSRVRNKLPTDIHEPVIAKVEADASPIIRIAFSSDLHSALEVTDVANRIDKVS